MGAHSPPQLGLHANETLPPYARTMHAFTLKQLEHHTTTRRARDSPRVEKKAGAVMLPRQSSPELDKLHWMESPRGTLNTPETDHSHGSMLRPKSWSVTESIRREFQEYEVRKEFAIV
jgi:hypothetical protein